MVAGMSRDEFVAHRLRRRRRSAAPRRTLGKIPGVHSGQHCANAVARDAVASKHWTPMSPLAARATVVAPRFPHNHQVSEARS